MAAPGSLYGEGAQMLQGAAQQQSEISSLDNKKTEGTVQQGEAAAGEIGAGQRQVSAQQAQQKLLQMEAESKLKGEMITITPQLALGLTKNTGDKSWLQSIGHSMRADVYTALYTHGMSLANAKKAPKITQVYDKDGKVRHAVVYTDEEGTVQQLTLDSGMAAENLHPNRGAGKGSNPSDMDFKKKKEFMRAYEKAKSKYSDPIRAEEERKVHPDQYDQDMQWLKDNQDSYDSITKEMSKGAGSGSVTAPSGGGSSSGAPFDPDAFIKEALGG